MAIKRPLRVFFGQFVSSTNPYAQIIDSDDKTFPQFLTGVMTGENSLLHTRLPADERGTIENWDEYIDLHAVSIDPVPANDIITFTDSAGIESDIQWKTAQQFEFLPNNRLSVEGPSIEWELGTRRLSYPDITSVLPPYIALTPNGHATHQWPNLNDENTKLQRMYITATIPGTERIEYMTGEVEDLYDSAGGQFSYLVIRNNASPQNAIQKGFILKNITQDWEVVAIDVIVVLAANPDNISGGDEIWVKWARYDSGLLTGIMIPNFNGPYVNTPADDSDFEIGDDYAVYEPNYVESHPVVIDYPIDRFDANDYLSISYRNSNRFAIDVQVYRCALVKNNRGGYVEADFPRLITNWEAWTGTLGLHSVQPNAGIWENTWAHNVNFKVPNETLTDVLVLKKVRNDAIARLNFDYRKRHRITSGQRTQLLLLLNYDTHHYYVGYLLSVSPIFEVNTSKRTEDSASFILKVEREGYFIEFNVDESAITNPDEPDAKYIPIQDADQPGKPIVLPGQPGTLPGAVVFNTDIETDYGAVVGDYLYSYVTKELGQILSITPDGPDFIIQVDGLSSAAESQYFSIYRKIDTPYIQFVTG